jgi:N-methylhydantoinase A/oxoprolinase/acetone carboxylase beta subunit
MKKKYSLGIDVGSTFTDGVLVDGEGNIITFHKVPTSASITQSIEDLLNQGKFPLTQVTSVRISTTHGLNALLQGKPLHKVGILRLMGHQPDLIPVGIGWPDYLKQAVIVGEATIKGGSECDGRPIIPLDPEELLQKSMTLVEQGAKSLAIVGVFSPLYQEQEQKAHQFLKQYFPDIALASSHECGGIGILERENATILNLALQAALTSAFQDCSWMLKQRGYHQLPFWIHNQGGLMTIDEVQSCPLKTIASGPSNSLLGGGKLAGLHDCVVIDIGGTSTDAGVVKKGFLRLRHHGFTIAGVRIGSVSSDVVSISLGGGSVIQGRTLTTESIGKQLFEEDRPLTLTDAAICAGFLQIPQFPVQKMSVKTAQDIVKQAANQVTKLYQNLDPERKYPCVLVGGGSNLLKDSLPFTQVPMGAPVANAYGAALAERTHTWCGTLTLEEREKILNQETTRMLEEARDLGIQNPRLVTLNIIPYHYIPGSKARVLIQVAGLWNG